MNSIFILVALIFGIGIGSIVSFIVTRKILSDIRNNELDNYEFIKRWSEITDKQYKDTRDYTGQLVDILKQQVDILIETDSKLLEAVKGMATAVDSSIKTRFDAFTADRLDAYDVLREDIDSMQTTSDNRWDLVHDYFVNQDNRMEDDCKRPGDDNKHLQDVIVFAHDKNVSIEIIPSENFGEIIIEVYSHGRCVQAALDLLTESSKKIGIETAFMAKVGELYTILNKEDTTNEHEEMEAGAGASEGGDAGHQEAEQDAVLPGEADGELVQSELAEDRLGNPSESEEGQGLDVSVLRAAVDAKLFSMDAAYDYDQH